MGLKLELIIAAMIAGCAATPKKTTVNIPTGHCQQLSIDKKELLIDCDGIQYNLFADPLRIERRHDFLSKESFTRSYFTTKRNGKNYMFKTKQLIGEKYPVRIVLETPNGYVLLKHKSDGEYKLERSDKDCIEL